jgi:NADH-quinone oxidoreductase subunit N
LARFRFEQEPALFGGQLAADGWGLLFRTLFVVVGAATLIVSASSPDLDADASGSGSMPIAKNAPASVRAPHESARGEFAFLVLVVVLGMNLLAMARSLLMVYVGMETVSVLSFALAAFRFRDAKSGEAALKYVVYGGVASGVMLYGMSWIYGLTGSLDFAEIAARIADLTRTQGTMPHAVFVGVLFALAGFGYKVAAVPFHMWAPDVYEGSPTVVAAFFSVGPKAAGLAALARFFLEAVGAPAVVRGDYDGPWPVLLGLLGLVTMLVGNLSALEQSNVKRLLAFSGIAHVGTMLLALAVADRTGAAATAFYVATYCLANFGAFVIVMAVAERAGGDESLRAMRGLGRRDPALAACMTVFILSLAGIPPLSGFVAKLYVVLALVAARGDYGTWFVFLAFAALANGVVALFYYARVLRAMYLEVPSSSVVPSRRARPLLARAALVMAVPTIALGVYWGPLYDFLAQGALP